MGTSSVNLRRSAVHLAAIIAVAFLGLTAWAQTVQSLLAFTGSNGFNPYTGLIEDAEGNFFGATNQGGVNNTGLIYELSPDGHGAWQQRIIYQFSARNGAGENSDGAFPQMQRLAMDRAGNLYGTATAGGLYGQGTVYKVLRVSFTSWRFTTLHSFQGGSDGASPLGGVAVDRQGNVYGTANSGGGTNCILGCGLVYELRPAGFVGYIYTVLHTFTGIPNGGTCPNIYDGELPYRMTPVVDAAGNVYGTTANGGSACTDTGTEWELSPAGGGNWTYAIIYAPGVRDVGQNPQAGMVLDAEGNLYGTCAANVIFELVKASGYQEQILFQGASPYNGDDYDTVTFDNAGNLYWTTTGGPNGYEGTIEELTNHGGSWTHSVLYQFSTTPAIYGNSPWAPVSIDSSGNLYGTNQYGGGGQGNDHGTVWEFTP